MVANPSNYRPPIATSRFNTTSFSRIESLRRLIQRRIEATFLVRGYDQSFCQAITDESMLAIHADIDECDQSDFREWVARIAVRIGFEKIRKLNVANKRLLKTQLPEKSEADLNHCDQPEYPELKFVILGDKAEEKKRVAQELLRLYREMVREILDGKSPFYVAYELNLSADFQQIFLGEAVRKLNLLRRYLRSEFEAPTSLR